MMRKVEEIAGPLRAYVAEVASTLQLERDHFEQVYAPRAGGLGFRIASEELAERAAWALAAQWIVGFVVGSLSPNATLADAEEWFLGEESRLPRFAPSIKVPGVVGGQSRDRLFALLPYLLDPLAPATRRCVIKSSELLADRLTRKAEGVFYTPADLAQYMSDTSGASQVRHCLDPACGTGVFLRAAQARSGAVHAYGCDLDPLVPEPCAFVLLANELKAIETAHPWRLWHLHRMKIATVDSLLVVPGSRLDDVAQRARRRELDHARESLSSGRTPQPAQSHAPHYALGDLFPDLVDGADVVLCNPPYARLRDHPDLARVLENFASLNECRGRSSIETSGPFLEHAWRLSNPAFGRAAVVVPLSVAFNSTAQFRGLRQAMSDQRGGWRCAFFDRTPDALFGDDVKTRNAILFYDATGARGLATTPVLRWTSRTRSRFFETIRFTPVGRRDGQAPIPKLGSHGEARLYTAARSVPGRFGDGIVRVGAANGANEDPGPSHVVYVAPTAYNWLSCSRSLDAWRGQSDISSSALTRIEFSDAETADAAYAVLCSRLVYWLWRVEGDAFHVTRGFLRDLPLPVGSLGSAARAALADLGAALWEVVEAHPVLSVNKGRRTIGFSATVAPDLLAEIDSVVLQAMSLTNAIGTFELAAWHESNVIVDPTDDTRASRPGRTKEWSRA
jgi:SAM-dependent methyltransferase